MKNNREKRIVLDMGILVVSCLLVIAAYYLKVAEPVLLIFSIVAGIFGIAVIMDIVKTEPDKAARREAAVTGAAGLMVSRELILLDEQEKPVKSWSLSGKTSMIIGRKNKDEDVDIDLSDCEYSTLIDIQHAVLNYCQDCWYLEDLDSHNGVKAKKVEDGVCYRLTGNRPCKIMPGDVIYIANTKLLFT